MATQQESIRRTDQQAASRDRSAVVETVVDPVQGASLARARRMEAVVRLAAPAALLLLWELASRTDLLDSRFFPAPSTIAGATWDGIRDGSLIEHTFASLRRVGIGFVVGAVPALALGLVLGFSRIGRAALLPLVRAIYPVPKTALAPLLLLIFGLGEPSKWVLVALGVFFPVFFNTMAGVMNLDVIYQEVARNYGASRLQFLRTVALPGSLPMIMTGLRLGVGMGLLLIAVAEIIGAKSGLGFLIFNSWQLFQVDVMYTGLIVLAVLGLVSQVLLDLLERRLVPWAR